MDPDHRLASALGAQGRVFHGVLGPTGSAPLVPTGIKIKRGVTVQWATGIAWVGGTGVGTGMGYQLGTSGMTGAMLDGAFPQVFIPADDVRKVSINAPQGMVRWFAT